MGPSWVRAAESSVRLRTHRAADAGRCLCWRDRSPLRCTLPIGCWRVGPTPGICEVEQGSARHRFRLPRQFPAKPTMCFHSGTPSAAPLIGPVACALSGCPPASVRRLARSCSVAGSAGSAGCGVVSCSCTVGPGSWAGRLGSPAAGSTTPMGRSATRINSITGASWVVPRNLVMRRRTQSSRPAVPSHRHGRPLRSELRSPVPALLGR